MRPRPFPLLAVCCALALGGCDSVPISTEPELPPVRTDTIGRLRVDGPQAYINGRLAHTGSYVIDGDTVSTGERTSAIVMLNDGGQIQLDAHTDPLIRQGICLLLKIARGKVAMHNLKCHQFEDPWDAKGAAHSLVHIEVTQTESRVTVLVGRVTMSSPTEATLLADQEYVAARDGTAQVLQLTPEQANARIAWTRNYFRARADQRTRGLSTAQASAIGLGIGWLLDRLGRRKSDRIQVEPRTQDTPATGRNPAADRYNYPPPQN